MLFVTTDRNAADMLTKCMKSPAKFFEFRAIIMNEPKVISAIEASARARARPASGGDRCESVRRPTSNRGGASVSKGPEAFCVTAESNCSLQL